MKYNYIGSSDMQFDIRTMYYAYIVHSNYIENDSFRNVIERLILQISDFIFYINFTNTFFVNKIWSKTVS